MSFVSAIGGSLGGVGLGSAVVEVVADTSQLTAGLAQARTQVASSTSGMSSAAKAASTGFIILGAAAAVAIGKGIEATTKLASEVRALQRVTGQSAESASALIAASAAIGIGVDQLSVGFGLLLKNIVNASPKLAMYGIVTRDATGAILPFDTVLANVIAKFQTLPEGADRAAFSMNVFGRSGKALIPLLSKGAEGIQELEDRARSMGLILSQEDVDAAKKLTVAQNALGEAFKGASIALGQSFIPLLTSLTNTFAAVVSVVSKVPAPILAVGLAVTVLTGLVAAATRVLGFFSAVWGPLTARIFGNAAAEEALGVTYVQTTLEIEAQNAALNTSKVTMTSLLPVFGFVGIAAGFAAIGMAENAKMAAQNAVAVDALTKAVIDGKTSLEAINREIANNPDIPDIFKPEFAKQLGEVVAANVKEIRDQVAAVNAELASVGKVAQPQLEALGEITGQTAGEFRDAFASALEAAQKAAAAAGEEFDASAASVDAFADTAKSAMEKAKTAIADFKTSATTSLSGFTNDALSALADKAHLTVEGVIHSFDRAAAATRRFGRDVLEISRKGGDAGKALAQQLLSMGPAAAGLASFIANASGKARDRMIAAFGAGGNAAENAASKITDVIVGTLDTVKALLEAIAKKWNIELDLPGKDKTKSDISGIHQNLLDLAGPFIPSINLDDNATRFVDALQGKLNALNNRVVTVRVNTLYYETNVARNRP